MRILLILFLTLLPVTAHPTTQSLPYQVPSNGCIPQDKETIIKQHQRHNYHLSMDIGKKDVEAFVEVFNTIFYYHSLKADNVIILYDDNFYQFKNSNKKIVKIIFFKKGCLIDVFNMQVDKANELLDIIYNGVKRVESVKT